MDNKVSRVLRVIAGIWLVSAIFSAPWLSIAAIRQSPDGRQEVVSYCPNRNITVLNLGLSLAYFVFARNNIQKYK